MAIITLRDAQLAFGHYPMLDHAEFSMEEGEKIGLIGRNGTGKSSLLQVLAGQAHLDDGFLTVQQNLSIAYVEQAPCYAPDKTVFEIVSSCPRLFAYSKCLCSIILVYGTSYSV